VRAMRICCVFAAMFSGLRARAKTRPNQSREPVGQWLSNTNAKMPAVSDHPFDTSVSPHVAETDPVVEQKFSTVHIVYLAAIAAATTGWIWLIARILMWSIAL
jgi:hypothetical protein